MSKNCPMRHENGNCLPAGGFCTANKNICEAVCNAYRMGKAQLSKEGTTDLISRQALCEYTLNQKDKSVTPNDIMRFPSVQPEPAIPLSWIENEIKWLKSLDNTFSEITALQISAMVNKWRDEQDE